MNQPLENIRVEYSEEEYYVVLMELLHQEENRPQNFEYYGRVYNVTHTSRDEMNILRPLIGLHEMMHKYRKDEINNS